MAILTVKAVHAPE